MKGPHTKVINDNRFIINAEDIADLNLVQIKGTKYPVYKDHIGYYILVQGKRINNGQTV